MFRNQKPDPRPLGVPLDQLQLLLGTGTVHASLERNALVVRNGRSVTRVEVVPPEPAAAAAEPIRAVVRVTTELPAGIRTLMSGREAESATAFNAMAALGAITIDRSQIFIGSRLTVFEREDAWERLHLPLLLFTALGATDGLLGAVRRSIGREPPNDQPSEWDGDDLESLAEMLSGHLACSTGEGSFTAEFGLESGARSAAAGHGRTALFQMRVDRPHPELGGGLFLLLHMPHPLSGERAVAQACARLNLLEMAAADRPPHFGAWCAGRMGPGVAYVSFIPNGLQVVPGIATNAVLWAMHRAEWADGELRAMGQRG